jgi:hypothetical protein
MKKILILAILLFPFAGFSQDIGDYLILNDIGGYKFRPKPTKRIYGNSGALIAASHFGLDHDDITYETRYILPEPLQGAEIQLTKHAGGDSDKWLLHELEDSYRDGEMETLGLLTEGAILRKIAGNKVFWIGLGGGSFMWPSNNIVVKISYRDLQGTKPEPLEVVQAYVRKFPPTIPSTFVLDRAHDEQWIKDEMERRLWLCDKWFLQLQMGKVKLDPALREVVDHMFVFLDYREKYYGVKGRDEKKDLVRYLDAKDGTPIKNKLTAYKTWWSVNKTKSINLP